MVVHTLSEEIRWGIAGTPYFKGFLVVEKAKNGL